MKNRTSLKKSSSKKLQFKHVFGKWVHDRLLFVWLFLLSFVVLDSFFTYLGMNYMGIGEKNVFVAMILGLGNGWLIWLLLKVVIAFLGTLLFFLVYYSISTSAMSKKEKEGVLLFELCGWVYLVSLNMFSVLIWSGTVLGRLGSSVS
ncbi:MAG: hypothetical protein KAR39_05690 [Thermoplasmata archaeon]|nr:hypothetical protein [Thermoplasmata archaeon]